MKDHDPNGLTEVSGEAQPFRRASPDMEASPVGGIIHGDSEPEGQGAESAWEHLATTGVQAVDVSPQQLATVEGRRAVWNAIKLYEQKVGPLLGIAGSARHGKTELAIRWDLARRRISGNINYLRDKTNPNQVILRPILNEHLHATDAETALKMFGILDLSGERLDQMVDARQASTRSPEAEYDSVTLAYIEHFLWPFGQRIQGLILAICFPILWHAVNTDRLSSAHAPTEEPAIHPIEYSRITESMLRRILHAVYQARATLGGIPIEMPRSDLAMLQRSRSWPKLDIPIFVALTKADLLDGLQSPIPGKEDRVWRHPAKLLRDHMPDLYQDLHQIARDFTVQYVHTFEHKVAHRTPSAPDPFQEQVDYVDHRWMVGHQVLDEFFARHPWQRWGLRSTRWLPKSVRTS
jgi:hypothetical protein